MNSRNSEQSCSAEEYGDTQQQWSVVFDHFQVGDCVLNHTNSSTTRRDDDLTFVVVPQR